jgi:hypothetical protein
MEYDERGGIRHRGRRLLTGYTAGYATAMARAHRDLTQLNTELQKQLATVRAELDELKALMQLERRLERRSTIERVQRVREMQAGLDTQRDPMRPLQ